MGRQVSGAVSRNRARRRLREAYRAARDVAPARVDLVVIGRRPALTAELRNRMGTAAVNAIKAIGYEGAGTVEEIVPAADPLSRTFLVKIDVGRDARLRSGLYGRGRFAGRDRDDGTGPDRARRRPE